MRKSILSRIVSEVRHPSECCDVKRCYRGQIQPSRGLLSGETMKGGNCITLPDSTELTLERNHMNRLAGCIVQIWARITLGADPTTALKSVFANTRRGANRLSKTDVLITSELLGDKVDPVESFDNLLDHVLCEIDPATGEIHCDRDSIELLARVLWFSKFSRGDIDYNKPGITAPIDSVIVNEETASLVKQMVHRVIRVVNDYGGVSDYRHRVMHPSGTSTIGFWEYELSSKNVVWLISYANNLFNSRISTAMVATYFFMLNEAMFDFDELRDVDSIGCIDPVSSEFMIIRFDEIDENMALNTMSQVNCFKSEIARDLALANVAGNYRSDNHPGSHRGNKPRRAKPGKVHVPSEAALAGFVEKNGKTSLYKIVSSIVTQKRGAIIPLGYFAEEPIAYGGEKNAEPNVTTANVRSATYVVPLMLRCTYIGSENIQDVFNKQFTGARLVDGLDKNVRSSFGIVDRSAVGYLEELINTSIVSCRENDYHNLARLCGQITWFNRFANIHGELKLEGVNRIDDSTLSENDIELMVLYYERIISGLNKIGGSIIGFDYNCISPDNSFIESAKVGYVTDKSIVRLTFSKNEPKAQDVLTDALCRHFGIDCGVLDEGITVSIINPRLGNMLVLPDDKIGAVDSAIKKLASNFTAP